MQNILAKIKNAAWFVFSSLRLDVGILRNQDWELSHRLDFLTTKYREILLVLLGAKKFKLGKSTVELFGRTYYYDSPYGLAGYQRMLVSHRNALKHADIPNVSTIVDIGANVGMFSMMAADLYPKAHIYAVEPIPQIYECLNNNLTAVNAQTFNEAITDEPGQVQLSFDEMNSAFSHIVSSSLTRELQDEDRIELISKEATTLDAFCEKNNIKNIDLLKIDMESFEAHVLRGGYNTLKNTKYLFLELSLEDNENYTFSEIHSLLYSQDFNFQLIYYRNFNNKFEGPLPVGDFLYKNYGRN